MSNAVRPVFFDPSRRRAIYLTRGFALGGLIVAAVLTVFVASLLAIPVENRVRLHPPHFLPDNTIRKNATLGIAHPPVHTPAHLPTNHAAQGKFAVAPGQGKGVVGAFFVNWDEVSIASLRQHANEITHLFPGWLHLDDDGVNVRTDDRDPSDLEAKRIALTHHLQIIPLLNNFSANQKDFDDTRLHRLLVNPGARKRVISQVRDYLLRNGYRGINIDLETDDEDNLPLLASFVSEMAEALHPHGLLVTADVQVDDIDQAAAIARSCDFVIPMIYDLHYATGDPGPIAPEPWARQVLDRFLERVPADKTVLAIGNYAYDWEQGTEGAKTLTFSEAMATAKESRDGADGVVQLDAASRNPKFTYEEDGKRHQVWGLDSVTAYNFQKYAAERGVQGRALWYIGSEDPTLWSFFAREKSPSRPSLLHDVHYGFEIDFEGEGELLDIAATPEDGLRDVTVNSNGYITGERFTQYPSTYIVRRSGWKKNTKGQLSKQIALTFDDGPDPNWTPQVLNALKQANIPATFFVIGENAQLNPDLLNRMWKEGHEIGNHSFSHPNLSLASEAQSKLEIDATQRAIQSAIGRSTPLFRPPYGIDIEPTTADELKPVKVAENLGYITVSEGIDPKDWDLRAHPTPEKLADSVLQQAEENVGNVVLLHDSGGDRSATIAAIPLIAERLRANGYSFVTVSQLMGQTNRAAFFPEVSGKERWIAFIDRIVFGTAAGTTRFIGGIFLFTLVAGTLRLLVVAVLAIFQRQREVLRTRQGALIPESELPSVSVIIAAYNEEKVISRTIQALLDGAYPRLEVIVVDDGSKDGTAERVRADFADEPRVRLLTKLNGGKASALNLGIVEATGEVLVGLDADTLFAPDTVHRLARHFADPTVGAVAGNIQVGNRNNLWTRWQAVEYTTSQNFDRRAYDLLNSITVVPGCVGAWRAEAVRQANGYATDTLAEDADLTWRVRRNGWRILSDSTAHAFTEAPEDLQSLLKQRFRWTFGTLQTLWKHRDMVFRRRYGVFGCLIVPSLWVFQMLLPLALPFADIGLLQSVLAGRGAIAGAYFLFFFLAEFSAARLAFHLDNAPRSRRQDLMYLFAQRIAYRYLLFYVLARAVLTALFGDRMGWNKLERRGTAVVGTTDASRVAL